MITLPKASPADDVEQVGVDIVDSVVEFGNWIIELLAKVHPLSMKVAIGAIILIVLMVVPIWIMDRHAKRSRHAYK